MRLIIIKYLILSIILSAFVLSPKLSRAKPEHRVGIEWNPPNDLAIARDELKLFQKNGVQYLMLNQQVRPAILDMLNNYSFKLYITIPNRFITTSDLRDHSKSILKKCQNYIHYYDHYKQIAAYGLFEYGETNKSYFKSSFNQIINNLRPLTERPFYYLTQKISHQPESSTFNFHITILSDAFIQKQEVVSGNNQILFYNPPKDVPFNVRNLEKLFRRTSKNSNPLLFFKSKWLFHLFEQHITIFEYISKLAKNSNIVFSTPPPPVKRPKAHWLVLLLLLLWGVIAVHYAFEPNYRKSLQRYFNNHIFFVNDIIERHARLTVSSLIVVLIQSILGGFFFYAISIYSFSKLGFEAITYHYPFLGFLNGSPISLLFLGFTAVLLYNLISIVWLYFGSAGITYFSQAVTLHMWTQHINIIIYTVILTLIMSGGYLFIIYALAVIFILIILMSFYITVFDTVKLSEQPLLQHLFTTVPHFILLVAALVWLIAGTSLINIWHFALTLS